MWGCGTNWLVDEHSILAPFLAAMQPQSSSTRTWPQINYAVLNLIFLVTLTQWQWLKQFTQRRWVSELLSSDLLYWQSRSRPLPTQSASLHIPRPSPSMSLRRHMKHRRPPSLQLSFRLKSSHPFVSGPQPGFGSRPRLLIGRKHWSIPWRPRRPWQKRKCTPRRRPRQTQQRRLRLRH